MHLSLEPGSEGPKLHGKLVAVIIPKKKKPFSIQ